ncbi:MAG: nuclear transport factor 2 family protein [Sphingomonadaceae bacterium]|nr:nuclear transport factor 2 family protein [Sphingomonadaceae bacterium]
MTDLEKLVAINEIHCLMARRVRALDAHDWETYEACHAEDHVSAGPQWNPGGGRKAMMDALKKNMDGIRHIHFVHSPMIEILSPTEARGFWTLEDYLYWKQGDEDHWFHGWGHYDDTYGVRDGQWLFTSRRLSYMRKEHSPGSRREGEGNGS